MKRKLWQFIFTVTILLSACGQTSTAYPPSATSTFLTTVLPSETLQPSATFTPTVTPIPATQTITPLPTIPTFTPTFDARTIVTVTPASPAKCPKEDPTLVPVFEIVNWRECIEKSSSCPYKGAENAILDFLNQGGSMKSVIQRLSTAEKSEYYYGVTKRFVDKDLTGDSIPELIFEDFGYTQRVHIFYCKEGKYEQFASEPPNDHPYGHHYIYSIDDLNRDGLPEVVVVGLGGCSFACFDVRTIGWNGNSFNDLSPLAGVSGFDDFLIRDVDNNGIKEIILKGGRVNNWDYALVFPWRLETTTYMWNGQLFSPLPVEYSPPTYRFQALNDADRYAATGNLDKALSLYQDVIFSDKLEWLSPERRKYELQVFYDSFETPKPTALPIPIPDASEYPKLAAYSYYRIMLLHTVRGYESDAGTVYSTLQQKFSNDQYGSPYAQMATLFWDNYQTTHKLYDGCAAAIQYAKENKSILAPLGGNYHGMQSHTYVPEDVCPFR